MNKIKKKSAFILLGLVFCTSLFAQEITLEKAREEAYKPFSKEIDLAKYPAKDPLFEENREVAKQRPGKRGTDQYISALGGGAYMVSYLAPEKQEPVQLYTLTYMANGELANIRLFSDNLNYPRSAAIYCVIPASCGEDKETKKYSAGERTGAQFHLNARESFYFYADGQFLYHVKDGKIVEKG